MTQTFEIYKSLEIAGREINKIKAYEIQNKILSASMGKFKNQFENVYFYYKDQTIIENMINDPVVQKAVKEIKSEWANGSQSEALRNKLVQMGNNKEILYEIFPDSKVTDQLLENIE